MKKMMLMAAALTLLATGAQANDKVQATCSLFGCVLNQTQDAETKVIHIPSGMQVQADDEQWLRFCRPRFLTDSLGVERAVYAHPGCDVGRKR